MKKRNILVYSTLVSILILFLASLIITKNFTFLSLILSSLSGLIVILTILFEGKIKGKNINPKQIVKLTFYGWVLIGLYFIFTIGTVITTNHSIRDSEVKTYKDSLTSANIISELKIKAVTDSIEIDKLKQITINNGLKSDSIKLAVVNNAIRALEEQKLIIERENQNIYLQFKNEVEDNLTKILTAYEENHIKGFKDTLHIFVATRLNNTYINRYRAISNNEVIIEFLMEVSEYINRVNKFADDVGFADDLKNQNRNLNTFLGNVKIAKEYLNIVFSRIYNINFYKDYENINFSSSGFKPIEDSEIEKFLIISGKIRYGKTELFETTK